MTIGACSDPAPCGASAPVQVVARWNRTWSPGASTTAFTSAIALNGRQREPLPSVVARQST